MGGLRAEGIHCQYTLTQMRLGKGNHCFGTLRSEGRTPPGGCPPSGCPQPGSCPNTSEELLTPPHLTHGSSGARHFKRRCSISNVLRRYWLKFMQREVRASLLRCYLWGSEQPLLGWPQEEGQTAQTAFLPHCSTPSGPGFDVEAAGGPPFYHNPTNLQTTLSWFSFLGWQVIPKPGELKTGN